MNKQKISRIFLRLKEEIPNPRSELNYSSHFELLVAVLLSAHTTDKSVNVATAKLFPVANTPEKMVALGEFKLKKYIQNLGLYNAKAANLIKTCAILIKQHHSCVPHSREALEALPGVGRKTANVVLNIAFDEPTVAVDTHLFRVANRTKIACGKTPLAVEEKLLKVIPQEVLRIAAHLLVLHGRYVCRARKPLCAQCVIRDLCEFDDKT
jgi:endonuclease III